MEGHNAGPENAAQGYMMSDLPERGRDITPLSHNILPGFGADTFIHAPIGTFDRAPVGNGRTGG